jgi:hypothetical protein
MLKTKLGYRDLLAQTKLPANQRKQFAIGRGGEKRIPRNFSLDAGDAAKYRELFEGGDPLPNPQNQGGAYYWTIETLKNLGLNKRHKFATFYARMKELMSAPDTKKDGKTAWQRFKDKDPATKNEDTALDVQGKVRQNLTVLQRVNLKTSVTPYGLKLLQMGPRVLKTKGCVINLFKGTGDEILVELNTDQAEPINELKRRGIGAPNEKPKAKAAKATKKPAKRKSGKPKTKAVKTETAAAEPVAAESAVAEETAKTE